MRTAARALSWTGGMLRCCGCLGLLLVITFAVMAAGALTVSGHGP